MNKPITVKQLLDYAKDEVKKGNGDKFIMISDDDEGNGYHYLWYSFTETDGFYIANLDTDIAKIEDTIILG